MSVLKRALAAAALASLVVPLAACNTVDGPADSTMSCFDYAGNKVVSQSVKDVYVDYNVMRGSDRELLVSGGAGCLYDSVSKTADIKAAESAAPYTVVVTNGVDKILLAGKFSDVANRESGMTELNLKDAKGDSVRHLEVTGLNVIATKNPAALSPALLQNSGLQP